MSDVLTIRSRGFVAPDSLERLIGPDRTGIVVGSYVTFAFMCLEPWRRRFVNGCPKAA